MGSIGGNGTMVSANVMTNVIALLVRVVSIDVMSGYPGVIAIESPRGSKTIEEASATEQAKTKAARHAIARFVKLITPPPARAEKPESEDSDHGPGFSLWFAECGRLSNGRGTKVQCLR